jgi:hypothetical protein
MSAGNVRFCGNVVLVSVRYALATGATALAVAIVLPSQPFLAVLAARLLVAKPSRGNDLAGLPTGMERCCGGSGFGRVLPQQFWLLLPAFQPTCPPRAPRHSPENPQPLRRDALGGSSGVSRAWALALARGGMDTRVEAVCVGLCGDRIVRAAQLPYALSRAETKK